MPIQAQAPLMTIWNSERRMFRQRLFLIYLFWRLLDASDEQNVIEQEGVDLKRLVAFWKKGENFFSWANLSFHFVGLLQRNVAEVEEGKSD